MSKKTEALEIILGLMPNAKFIDKNGKDVTEDVKKSQNTEENEPKTHKSLTEQWKKGELEQGWYYVLLFSNEEYITFIDGNWVVDDRLIEADIKEVLAPVQSYEEWQQMKAFCEEFNALNVAEENRSLKEKLEPFTDPYFRGLTTKNIAELAKKSIRITTQHCEDTTTIFNLKELLCCCADELDAIEDKDIELERLLEEIEKALK